MSYTVDEETRIGYIEGLSRLASLLAGNPDLQIPLEGQGYSPLAVFVDTKEQLVAWAKALPGTKEKTVTDDSAYGFQLYGHIAGLGIRVYAPRDEVCTARVVGAEPVTRKVAVEFEERTEMVDVIEWDCAPILSENGVQ